MSELDTDTSPLPYYPASDLLSDLPCGDVPASDDSHDHGSSSRDVASSRATRQPSCEVRPPCETESPSPAAEPEREPASGGGNLAALSGQTPASHVTGELSELPGGLAPLVELLATRTRDPETIRELLDIQREYRAERAREAYSEALARFRAVAPTLEKDRTVHFESRDKGKSATHYRHTSIGYAMSVVNPLLGSLGLNLSWHPSVEDGVIHVETRLTHALGHSESITLPGAPDTSGNKNAIQAMKSTITYLERCGAFALLGLASSDDDDGRAAVPPAEPEGGFVTFEQAEDLSNLLDLIETLDPGYRSRFVAHYSGRYAPGDNPLGLDLPLEMLERATRMLKRKLADVRTSAASAARVATGASTEASTGEPSAASTTSAPSGAPASAPADSPVDARAGARADSPAASSTVPEATRDTATAVAARRRASA